jgi:hypothetical protein
MVSALKTAVLSVLSSAAVVHVSVPSASGDATSSCFGYGCASMTFSQGHMKGNVWVSSS